MRSTFARRALALAGTSALLAGAGIVAAGPASAWTLGVRICHNSGSDRGLLTTKADGKYQNVAKGECVRYKDFYYIPSGCTGWVVDSFGGSRKKAGQHQTSPLVKYGVRVDC